MPGHPATGATGPPATAGPALQAPQQQRRPLHAVRHVPEEAPGGATVADAVVEGQGELDDLADGELPSCTHGLGTMRPTPSIAASGWLMIGVEPSTPNTP